MKKITIIFGLLLIAIVCQAQISFFKPVPKDYFKTVALKQGVTASPTSLWVLRPAVSLTAVQLTWNKTTKTFNSQAFASTGLGIGYQHYVEVDGVSYNNYGFNALLLFGAPTSTDPASLSVIATISAFKFVSIGGGYNFGNKVPLILTGISYNF